MEIAGIYPCFPLGENSSVFTNFVFAVSLQDITIMSPDNQLNNIATLCSDPPLLHLRNLGHISFPDCLSPDLPAIKPH